MPPPERPDQTPADLADDQGRRERDELERAARAPEESETRAHERRAEKAGYLREKLEEQAESDRDGP
ncbi:MAG: hypothetical protein ACR2KV_17540 [Solirubrobacteraceae bacterium]